MAITPVMTGAMTLLKLTTQLTDEDFHEYPGQNADVQRVMVLNTFSHVFILLKLKC